MPRTVAIHTHPRYQRQPAGWAKLAAYPIGVAPATVEASVHGTEAIHERMGHIIRALVATGDTTTLAKVLTPIHAALATEPADELTPALITRAQEADVEEEISETRYLTEATPAHLRAWRVALETQMGLARRLHQAMIREEARC